MLHEDTRPTHGPTHVRNSVEGYQKTQAVRGALRGEDGGRRRETESGGADGQRHQCERKDEIENNNNNNNYNTNSSNNNTDRASNGASDTSTVTGASEPHYDDVAASAYPGSTRRPTRPSTQHRVRQHKPLQV